MSLYNLSSGLGRGQDALEQMVHFPLGHKHNSPPSRCQPWRCWHHRPGWQETAAPSPFLRKMRAHPPDGVPLASDVSSSPLLNQRTPEFLLAALLL